MTTTIVFNEQGTFKALWAAEAFMAERGFSVGYPQGSKDPRGILFGDFTISKWRGMNKAEISALHGVMRSGDMREGPIYVDLFDSAPAAALAALQAPMVPA